VMGETTKSAPAVTSVAAPVRTVPAR
jgi:hypothetical protein